MNYRNLRKIKGYIMLIMSTMAAVIGVILLFAILYKVIQTGMAGLNLSLFTQDEAPAWLEGEGGMRHAFIGQIILTFFASLIGIPIGILGGIYLSEYGRYSKIGRFISSLAEGIDEIARAVRGHWMVESYHWHLDVTFREDGNHTLEKQAAYNLNIIRKLALNMLKLVEVGKKGLSVKKKRYAIGTNPERYLEEIMNL